MKSLMLLFFIALSSAMQQEKFDSLRIYQIFVGTYADGDKKIGYEVGWGPEGVNYGGDLKGITTKLKSIAEMGFNAIWLSPIFDSKYTPEQQNVRFCHKHSSTGYFAIDYFNVDPHFGTNEDFKKLVDTAHENNLYVFLDGVFGHFKGKECGVEVVKSPMGNKPAMIETSASDYSRVDYNDDGQSLNFYKEVIMHWTRKYDVDGWRLDVADELTTTPDQQNREVSVKGNLAKEYLETLNKATKLNEMDGKKWGRLGFMVGEIYYGDADNIAKWFGTTERDSIYSYFDFPSYFILARAFAEEQSGSKHETDFEELEKALEYPYKKYPTFAHPNLFLGNHDIVRFGNLIARRWGKKPTTDEYFMRLLAAQMIQIIHPGPITVYYGEEYGEYTACYETEGKCGGAGNDNVARTNIEEDSKLTKREKEHKENFVKLMKWRAEHPLAYCKACTYTIKQSSYALCYHRKNNGTVDDTIEELLYCVNYRTSSYKPKLAIGQMKNVMTGETVDVNENFAVDKKTFILLAKEGKSYKPPTYTIKTGASGVLISLILSILLFI